MTEPKAPEPQPERVLVTVGDDEGTSVLAEMSEHAFERLVRSLCGAVPQPVEPEAPPVATPTEPKA